MFDAQGIANVTLIFDISHSTQGGVCLVRPPCGEGCVPYELKFTTLSSGKTVETAEKKSRFISCVFPILSIDNAEQYLREVRERYAGANHHCYAYRVGVGVPIERFSDDGEPSGTAGRPILEVIRRQGLDNVLVVVTRYFGGVLLGANGLVRAYTDGAAQGLNAAPKMVCGPMRSIMVECDYGLYGKLEYALASEGITMREPTFLEHVSFTITVASEAADEWVAKLTDWTNGQVSCHVGDEVYMGVTEDGNLVRDVWPSVET